MGVGASAVGVAKYMNLRVWHTNLVSQKTYNLADYRTIVDRKLDVEWERAWMAQRCPKCQMPMQTTKGTNSLFVTFGVM